MNLGLIRPPSRALFTRIIAVFLGLVLSPLLLANSFTMELSEAQLQQTIASVMPLENTKFFVTVNLADPKIELQAGSDEISISSRVSARIPGDLQGSGFGRISGKIHYDAQQGAFYLQQPRLREFHIDNLPAAYAAEVRDIAQSILQSTLVDQPVYTLNDANLKERLTRASLKSVKVKDGKLLVELAPY